MANKSVLELAVQTGQWDAGLKKAKTALQNFTDASGGLQRALTADSASMQKFVQMMGRTDSQAKTAKGRLNDYKSTIEQLVMQYNQMNDAQKRSIGQDYLRSIDQLKQKYQDVNKQIQEMNRSLAETPDIKAASGSGIFSGFSGKMEGALAVFGGNLMTKAAGAVAQLGSEMYGMVQQGVELAKQGEGIRIAFERIGRGDLLDGLRQATHGTITDLELMKAAVRFDDFKLPLDQLGTMLAFAQQKAKDTGQSFDYMVESIVTGLGRQSPKILDNLGLSITEIHQKTKETGDMTKAVGQIIREQMAKAGDYVETAADRAAQANVNLQNKMEELGRKFAPVEEASSQLWTSMKIGILDIIGGPLATLLNQLTQAGRMANAYGLMGGNAKVGRMTANLAGASEGKRQSIYQQQQEQFWRYINPREQQIRDIRAWQSGERNEALQKRIGAITEKYGSLDATKIQAEVDAAKKMLSDYQAAAKQILQPIEQKIEPTFGDGGSGVKSGKVGSSKGFDISSIAFDANKAGLAAAMSEEEPSEIWKAITEGAKESKNSVDELTAALVALNEAEGVTVKDTKKDSKELGKNWKDAAGAILGVGSAMSQIEDPAAKVMGTVAQAIATVALGAAQAIATPKDPWTWIAFAATATATMISTIASIHAATGYASGGVIKGNSYSGDNIMGMVDGGGLVGLNAGEIVLNKAQTASVANELTNNQPRAMRVNGRISGHDIVLAADRSLAQEGKGHIVTWK